MPFSPPSPSDIIEDEKPSFVPPKPGDILPFDPPSPESELPFEPPKPSDRVFHTQDGSEIPVSQKARSWLESLTGLMQTPGVEPPEQRRVEAERAITAASSTPLINVTSPTAEEMTGSQNPSTLAKVVAGVGQSAASIVSGLTTPAMIETGMVAPGLAPGLGKAVATGFGAQIASTVPEQYRAVTEAADKGDIEGVARGVTSLAASGGMLGMIGTHVAKSGEIAKPGDILEKPSPVPEPIHQTQAQIDATLDPDSTKAATLITKGSEMPHIPDSLVVRDTDQGPVAVNPAKADPDTVAADINAGKGGNALGYHNDAKPTGSNLVAVTRNEDGVPVQEEVVSPETAEDAAAAGKAAVPGGKVELRHADEVLEERENAMQGMGGAVPGEFTPSGGTPTSIKNAQIEEDASILGLQNPIKAARETNPQQWDRAMAMMDEDPGRQDTLISRLQEDPGGSVSAEENMMLLHRKIDLDNQLAKVERQTAQAYQDGRMEDYQEGKLQIAKARDDVQEMYDVYDKAGTRSGRALQSRQHERSSDFSYGKMASEKEEALGRPLTEPEKDKIQSDAKAIQEADTKADEAQEAQRQTHSEAAVDETIKAAKERADKEPSGPQYSPEVLSFAEKMVRKWEAAAAESSKALREMLGRTSVGVDPAIIGHVAKIGLAKLGRASLDFSRWSSEMVKDFGEKITPYLKEGYDAAIKLRDKALTDAKKEAKKAGVDPEEVEKAATKKTPSGTPEAIADRIKEAAQEGRPVEEVGNLAHKLALALVRDGITQREPVVDYVHDALSEAYPEITRRESMDAISGLGRFKPLDPEAAKATLRDIKGQLQQIGKLENLRAKEPLPKSGVEQRIPSEKERRLIQQVNEAKKRLGVVTTDPARQLRSTLDAIKKRLDNAIADAKDEIATRTRRTKSPSPTDPVIEAKRAELKELNRQKAEIFGKPELTDEQRIERAKVAVQRSIEQYEERLKSKDTSTLKEPSKTPSNAELDAMKAKRDALKEEFEELRKQQNPSKTQEEIANQSAKTRITNRIAELEKRLAYRDFAPRPKPEPLRMSPEVEALKARAAELKQEVAIERIKSEAADRGFGEKAASWMAKTARAFMLSHLTVLGKLAGATFARLATVPTLDLIGAVGGKFSGLSELAGGAPIEGGFNVRAIAKLWTEGLRKGLSDANTILKTGSDNLDKIYGKGSTQALKEAHIDPSAILDFFGKAHAMMKSVLKRGAFEYAMEKQLAWSVRRGIDTTTPAAQAEMGLRAYDFAQRMIFMQENHLVNAYRAGLRMLDEAPSSKLREVPGGVGLAKTAALGLRMTMPIVKVPSNIFTESLEGQHGLVTGSIKWNQAMRAGLDNVSPSEKDQVMRLLKNGSAGAALIALGYYNRKNIGGFYQQGVYKKGGEPKYGTININGVTVPSYMLHHMPGLQYQFGASWGNIADQIEGGQQRGDLSGFFGAERGLSETMPFGRQAQTITDLLGKDRDAERAGRNLAKGLLIPGAVQDIAKWTDVGPKGVFGPSVVRENKNIGEALKSGVPGLRETVPPSPYQD